MINKLERIPVRALANRRRRRVRFMAKRLGEVGEAALLPKAQYVGLGVAKAWGDSDSYDYILDSGWVRWRTQVKCTARLHAGAYEVQVMHSVYGQGKRVYTAEEVDLIVVYVLPCDAWYVFPIEVLGGKKSLRLYPHCEREGAKWEKYREAWHLLLEPCPGADCPEKGLCKGLKDWRKCFLDGVGADPGMVDP